MFKKSFLEFATKGVPDLDLPVLDPLKVPILETQVNFQNLAVINATLRNIVVSGISGLQLDSYK